MNNFAAVGLAGAAGLAVTTGLGFAMVPWLRKLKFGQTILDIGPKWHKSKQGTPTMGGLMFIIGTVAAIAVTVITDKLTGGDIVASGSLVPSEMYTRLWSGLVEYPLGVVAGLEVSEPFTQPGHTEIPVHTGCLDRRISHENDSAGT